LNLLITGGAGFIGSNFIPYILKKRKDIKIFNLDKLSYAGSLENLCEVEDSKRYTFINGDICDGDLVEYLLKFHRINGIIHFAAESHVDNSIISPTTFINTNVLGTATLLDCARKVWMNSPGHYKDEYKNARFHHISTDEVFGSLGDDGYFTEESPYLPNSPYSASKASSDMIVRSYFKTYGMNVVTTNCSNNYGPKQHEEKLIPTIIRKALAHEDIPIYGNGQNIRDWLYVEDHCKAIEMVFFNGKSGESYLIGGNNEIRNIDIATQICNILDQTKPINSNKSKLTSYKQLIKFVKERPGHDYRYAINFKKIKEEIGWIPEHTFIDGLTKTINYYLQKYSIRDF